MICEDIVEGDKVIPARDGVVVAVKSVVVDADGFNNIGSGKVLDSSFVRHQSNSCFLIICKEVAFYVETSVCVVRFIRIVDELDSVSFVANELVVSNGDVDEDWRSRVFL